MLNRRTLAALLAIPSVLYALGFWYLRPFGEVPLLFCLACSLAACVVGRERVLTVDYFPFAGFATLILALSLLQIMPDGWTRFYDNAAALRHWIFVPALPILIGSSRILVLRFRGFVDRHAFALFATAFIVSRVLLAMSYVGAPSDGNMHLFRIYTITNENAYVVVPFLIWFLRNPRPVLVDAGILLIALALSSSSQSLLFFLLVAMLRFARDPTRPMLIASGAILAFILISPLFVAQIAELDFNSGVRAVMWRDTWEAIVQTWGVGVGYGTEYIRNDFSEIAQTGWIISTQDGDQLFVGTHSAFYDILLRNGVIGFALFAYWFIRALSGPRTEDVGLRRLTSAIALLLITTCAVNVGVSSMSFIFGVSMSFAVLRDYRLRPGGVEIDAPAEIARPVAGRPVRA